METGYILSYVAKPATKTSNTMMEKRWIVTMATKRWSKTMMKQCFDEEVENGIEINLDYRVNGP